MKKEKKNEILLESGTNEIEIMEFTISGNTFGINVAKVREIIMPSAIKAMPHSHPSIEGVFKPRESVITVINLPQYLGLDLERPERTLLIVTNFNKMHVAFRVHTVVGIDRISWKAIEKPDKTIYGGTDGIATGIAQCEDRLITILDFEKIVADISPETGIQMDEIERLGTRVVDTRPILLAEDSVLLSKMITECLNRAGYTNIIKCDDGEQAWQYMEKLQGVDRITDKVACIVTDIEMPRMDGHRFTKLVKSNPKLKVVPVVIFSSLINEEMRRKGKEVGADEQLSKPEIAHLVEVVDLLIERSENGEFGSSPRVSDNYGDPWRQ